MTDSESRTLSGPASPFASVHERLGQRLHEVFPSNAARAVQEAYGVYVGVLQEPWAYAEFSRRVGEAYTAWSARLRAALGDGRAERALEAYRQYVRDLKLAWSDVDPESLGPEDLAALAQGMSWAAGAALEATKARSAE